MVEPVRALEATASEDSRPTLAAVADVARRVPSLKRWAFLGGAVGFVVITGATILAALAQGVDLAAASGLGVAVGIFGGLGFGCMMGSVLALALAEQADRDAVG